MSVGSTEPIQDFLGLSAELTGFRKTDLQGTGMVQVYYDTVTDVVGERICGELWSTWNRIISQYDGEPNLVTEEVGRLVLGDKKLGPVARAMTKLWYLGNWDQLPPEWRDEHGASAPDADHVVSGEAYREGLVWTAMGTHPMAAKQPGFGSWGMKPTGLHDDGTEEAEHE